VQRLLAARWLGTTMELGRSGRTMMMMMMMMMSAGAGAASYGVISN
jgi:hypothetical protein